MTPRVLGLKLPCREAYNQLNMKPVNIEPGRFVKRTSRSGREHTWRRAYAALVIGLVLQAGLAAAQNLVTNPGFETGDTSGWFAFGTPTIAAETSQVHSGTYAALVSNRSATYMGIAQSFVGVLQSGQNYNVSAWVSLVSGANQTMHLTMQKTDGSGLPTPGATITHGPKRSMLHGIEAKARRPGRCLGSINWTSSVSSDNWDDEFDWPIPLPAIPPTRRGLP